MVCDQLKSRIKKNIQILTSVKERSKLLGVIEDSSVEVLGKYIKHVINIIDHMSKFIKQAIWISIVIEKEYQNTQFDAHMN